MKLDRASFLKAVQTCKPAIGTKDLIPELMFLFSDGETLTAYDDTIGIIAPFASEFKGGVKGALLLGILANSSAKEVTLEQTKASEMQLKAGRFSLKLALLDVTAAVHQLPDIKSAKKFALSASFYEALRGAAVCLGNTSSAPDQLGVLLVLDTTLQFYATDGPTMANAALSHNNDKWPLKQHVILPTRFVEQLLKLPADATTLYLTDNEALAVTSKGLKLFARLVDNPRPHDFKAAFKHELQGTQSFAIPKRLTSMLERAMILYGDLDEREIAVDLAVDQGVLRMLAETQSEQLNDSTKLEDDVPNAAISVNPKLLKKLLPFAERMSFTENALLLQGKNVLYLLGSYSVAK